MEAFSPDQWLVLLLAFLLGLFLGMAFLANSKWKGRYREESRLRAEEVRRREALEAERKTWETRAASERAAAERAAAERARDDRPPPPVA